MLSSKTDTVTGKMGTVGSRYSRTMDTGEYVVDMQEDKGCKRTAKLGRDNGTAERWWLRVGRTIISGT